MNDNSEYQQMQEQLTRQGIAEHDDASQANYEYEIASESEHQIEGEAIANPTTSLGEGNILRKSFVSGQKAQSEFNILQSKDQTMTESHITVDGQQYKTGPVFTHSSYYDKPLEEQQTEQLGDQTLNSELLNSTITTDAQAQQMNLNASQTLQKAINFNQQLTEQQVQQMQEHSNSQNVFEYRQPLANFPKKRKEIAKEEEEVPANNPFFTNARPQPTVVGQQQRGGKMIKNVFTNDLRQFMRSKKDIYNLLSVQGQYYLPPYNECTIEYLRDIFAGKKKCLLNSNVKIVTVPRIGELTASNLQQQIHDDQELKLYFPDFNEKRPLNRSFLFNVINTVRPEFFPENIQNCLQQRKEMEAQKKSKYIEMTSEFYDLVMNSSTLSKSQRGKALDLLNVGAKKRKKPERQQQQIPLTMQLTESKIGVQNASNQFSHGRFNKRFKHNSQTFGIDQKEIQLSKNQNSQAN